MIVIIGGGISGLTLAHELARRGRPFLLLEASSRVGGVIRSGRTNDGRVLEFGPQRARLSDRFASLVDELELRDAVITSPRGLPLFVFRRGRLRRVPSSPSAFMTSDIISARGRLRMLIEPLTGGARSDETVADYFTRKLGREAYESIVGPLYGGLYASDPREMLVGLSLEPVLRELAVSRSLLLALLRRRGSLAPPDACSFQDGLETLVRALHDRHAAHIRVGTSVQYVERASTGWTVVTDDDRIGAEHVVITTAAAPAAHVLRHIAPDAAAHVGALAYNPLAIVHLDAPTGLHGMGCQVAFDERMVTRGVTWNDSLFGESGRAGVYTAFLGGAMNPRIATEDPQRIADRAVSEFRMLTGFDARVLDVTFATMPAWDRTWSGIRSLELPKGIHIHANWRARPGLPGRLAESARLAALLE